ncbi:hypothetical protein HZC32_00895 [Candidatus Woesearchaeota archaeon]|nr:hypothetical protein [Candidatus Woesearchaeota archaeon]
MQKEILTFKPGELLPAEKGKVENLLTSCIERLGDEALLKLGLQAGYINVPADITSNPSQHLKISPFQVLPYWAYGQETNIPSLLQIQDRINAYLQLNLRSCVSNWEPFKEEYDIIEKGPLTVNTEIVESKVIFNVRWDLEIRNKAGEIVVEIVDHVAESPIQLKKVYDTAKLIVTREMETLKLEDITQDLIALEAPNVPVAGVEIRCSKKTWDVNKVKSGLLQLLSTNIKELKIKGTDFVEFPEGLLYYQYHYVWDIGEEFKQPKVSVHFRFDESDPFHFSVTPLSGTKMSSSQIGGGTMLSYLCVQTWKFTYDLVYPVKVRVRDETTGYNFEVAFKVHLIENQPNRGEALAARPSYLLNAVTNEDYCKPRNIPLTIKTYEAVANGEGIDYRNDLEGVNLSFTCIQYRCDLGKSEYDFAHLGFSGVSTNLPYCVGGILRGTKENYIEDWKRIVPKANEIVELNLIPVVVFPASNIRVVKHDFKDPKHIGPATKLGSKEFALIRFSFRNDNTNASTAKPATAVVEYSPLPSNVYPNQNIVLTNESLSELQEQKLMFLARADFAYDLELSVFRQEGDEAKFIGGYKGKWLVPWEKLKNAQTITYHVLSKDRPSEEESYEMMMELAYNSVYLPPPEIK